MSYDLENRLVIGVSSRALFDLTVENEIFCTQGVEAYCRYQVEHEKELLKPGNGFRLVEALLNINKLPGQEGRVEVIIMSHNSPDTSLRVFNAIGYVADLEFCKENGQIEAFLVPEPGGCFGCFVNKVIRIPYCNVVRIGPDVIVVKHQPPPPPRRKNR